jgi:hypothetical protein
MVVMGIIRLKRVQFLTRTHGDTAMEANVSNEFTITEAQLQKAIRGLRKAFRNASNTYWDGMKKTNKRFATFVMRDTKTMQPVYEKDVDYTLYHAQQEFSYIIDELQRGPLVLAPVEIKKANDLIESLMKVSSQ